MVAQIIQFFLSISILVFIHELGHFLAAKLFKMKVEKFYLFFNPKFSLFKFKKGETEYGIGWIPLGGYVKIAGMIDESMDKEQMKKPPQPWEFRAKPAWQRFIVMIAGVVFNLILAIIIYIGIVWHWGENYLPTSEVNKYGIMVDSIGKEIGLQNGDKILLVNGKQIENFSKITGELILNEPHKLTILRNHDTIEITLIAKDIEKILKYPDRLFSPRFPAEIYAVLDSSYAQKAGIKPKDKIIKVDTIPIQFFDELKEALQKYKNQEVALTILRDSTDTIITKVFVPQEGKIGIIANTDLTKIYQIKTYHYNFWQSIPRGIQLSIDGVKNMLKQLKLLATPKTGAYKSVGSFIAIGSMFDKAWDWLRFWTLTAFLSIMLAVLNLLPIPALDGGHAVFALWEMITGKKPSDKFLEIMQIIGFIILISLLILALRNDIMRYIFKKPM